MPLYDPSIWGSSDRSEHMLDSMLYGSWAKPRPDKEKVLKECERVAVKTIADHMKNYMKETAHNTMGDILYKEKKEAISIYEQERRTAENKLKKKLREEERKALSWKFTLPAEGMFNPIEVASTLSRKNPIAIVEAATFGNTCYAVVNSGIVQKAIALNIPIELRGDQGYQLPDRSIAFALDDATQIPYVLKWAREVVSTEWEPIYKFVKKKQKRIDFWGKPHTVEVVVRVRLSPAIPYTVKYPRL